MITCDHCRHFQTDAINPLAGMGRCMYDARHGYFYPGEKHRCDDFVHSHPDSPTGKTSQGRGTRIGSTSTASEGAQ